MRIYRVFCLFFFKMQKMIGSLQHHIVYVQYLLITFRKRRLLLFPSIETYFKFDASMKSALLYATR